MNLGSAFRTMVMFRQNLIRNSVLGRRLTQLVALLRIPLLQGSWSFLPCMLVLNSLAVPLLQRVFWASSASPVTWLRITHTLSPIRAIAPLRLGIFMLSTMQHFRAPFKPAISMSSRPHSRAPLTTKTTLSQFLITMPTLAIGLVTSRVPRGFGR